MSELRPRRHHRLPRDVRASSLLVGDTYEEPGMEPVTITSVRLHGDTVLVTGIVDDLAGYETALDRDEVVILLVSAEPDDAPEPLWENNPTQKENDMKNTNDYLKLAEAALAQYEKDRIDAVGWTITPIALTQAQVYATMALAAAQRDA